MLNGDSKCSCGWFCVYHDIFFTIILECTPTYKKKVDFCFLRQGLTLKPRLTWNPLWSSLNTGLKLVAILLPQSLER